MTERSRPAITAGHWAEPALAVGMAVTAGSAYGLPEFNFYGGLWTDFFLADVQNRILDLVKARSEAP